MELDDLKIHWKNQPETTTSINQKILDTMLSNQSKNPVAIMKRNLQKELWFVLIGFSVAAVIIFTTTKGITITYGWIYIFMMMLFAVYYYFKNKLLNNMQCISCEVRSNLTLQLNSLEKYVKRNLIISTLIFPAFLMISALLIYLKEPSKVHTSVIYYTDAYPAWLTTLVWLGIALLLTIPLYYLNKKYLYKLYGKHIKRLHDIVDQMESE